MALIITNIYFRLCAWAHMLCWYGFRCMIALMPSMLLVRCFKLQRHEEGNHQMEQYQAIYASSLRVCHPVSYFCSIKNNLNLKQNIFYSYTLFRIDERTPRFEVANVHNVKQHVVWTDILNKCDNLSPPIMNSKSTSGSPFTLYGALMEAHV